MYRKAKGGARTTNDEDGQQKKAREKRLRERERDSNRVYDDVICF